MSESVYVCVCKFVVGLGGGGWVKGAMHNLIAVNKNSNLQKHSHKHKYSHTHPNTNTVNGPYKHTSSLVEGHVQPAGCPLLLLPVLH